LGSERFGNDEGVSDNGELSFSLTVRLNESGPLDWNLDKIVEIGPTSSTFRNPVK
jgi:hypothetical protein